MKLLSYLGIAVVMALISLLVVWSQQRRLIYFPDPNPGPPPRGWDEVKISTGDDLDLVAWHRGSDRDMPLVVVFPGNGGNREGRLPLGDALAIRGLEVLLVEYRGYGGNPGSPSEIGLAEDARSASRLADELAAGRPIIYYGESLGAAVATGLAAGDPPDALVLGSPFTSLREVGRFHYPWAPTFLHRESYPSLERCGSGALAGIPVLVLAGSGDSIVPVEQSRAIAESLGAELYEVEGVDHNDPAIRSSSDLADRVAAFIDRSVGG